MPYEMHRVFCATPGDLEEERQAFYQIMGDFNEQQAMPRNVLLVSVSVVPNMVDTRPFQSVLRENIRACRYYIQLLEDSWGPPQKNFEREYALARQYEADAALPMQEVAVLFKKPLLPHKVETDVSELKQALSGEEFGSLEDFRKQLWELLAGWLETIRPAVPNN